MTQPQMAMFPPPCLTCFNVYWGSRLSPGQCHVYCLPSEPKILYLLPSENPTHNHCSRVHVRCSVAQSRWVHLLHVLMKGTLHWIYACSPTWWSACWIVSALMVGKNSCFKSTAVRCFKSEEVKEQQNGYQMGLEYEGSLVWAYSRSYCTVSQTFYISD